MVIFDYTILLRPFGGKICLRQTAASSGDKKLAFCLPSPGGQGFCLYVLRHG